MTALTRIAFGLTILFGALLVCVFGSAAGDASSSLDVGLIFDVEPSDTVAVRNSDVLLNCSARITDPALLAQTTSSPASSTPPAVIAISWRKDGQPLNTSAAGSASTLNDTRRVLLADDGSSLVVRRVQARTDAGDYECVAAVAGVGVRLSRRASLRVAELSRFSAHPRSLTVDEGKTARFICSVSGIPDPVITWEKNGLPIPMNSDRFVQLTTLGILQIENVRLDDAGAYGCVAVNSARQRRSNDAELYVEPATTPASKIDVNLLVGPEDTEFVVGQTVVLECAAVEYGSGANEQRILWRKDDGVLPAGRTRMIGRGNLEIRDIEEDDDGLYVCYFSSDQVVAAEARLSVLVPPRAIRPMVNLIRPLGQGIRLMCNVTGIPPPTLTWMKDGEPITHSRRTPDRELVIAQASHADQGLYQCWAENIAGRIGLTSRIVVDSSSGDGPDPPASIEARVMSSRAIEVLWSESPSKDGRQIIAYSVHYYPTNGGDELQSVVEGFRIVIQQLTPYTEYSFYVVAYNDQLISKPSAIVTQRTQEDVPVTLPQFSVTKAGATSLRIQWDRLPAELARGVITQHLVKYRRHGVSSAVTVDLPASATEYTISELESGTRYDILVLAGTSAGFPPESPDTPWETHTVGDFEPPCVGNMTNVKLTVVDPTSIALRWDRVTPDSVLPEILLGFKIYFRTKDEVYPKTIILVDSVTEHTLVELVPNTTYEINFCIFTVECDGQMTTWNVQMPPAVEVSSTTTVAAAPPAPQVPVGLEVEALNETAVRLSWQKPVINGNLVTQYTVQFFPDDAVGVPSKDASTRSIGGESTRLVIGGLEPFTTYRFTICSHIESRRSAFGEVVRGSTTEGRPSAPYQLTWLRFGETDVHLSWQPPSRPNGIVTAYVISYCDARAIDVTSTPPSACSEQRVAGSSVQAVIRNLNPDTMYQFWVRAVTSRGAGPATDMVFITITSPQTTRPIPGPNTTNSNDRMMGIIIGVAISGACIVVCVVIILLRNRCVPINTQSDGRNYGAGRANGCICHETSLLRGCHDGNGSGDLVANGYCTGQNGHSHRLVIAPHIDSKGYVSNGCCHGNSVKLLQECDHHTALQPACDTYITQDGHGTSCVVLDYSCRGDPQVSPKRGFSTTTENSPMVIGPHLCPQQQQQQERHEGSNNDTTTISSTPSAVNT